MANVIIPQSFQADLEHIKNYCLATNENSPIMSFIECVNKLTPIIEDMDQDKFNDFIGNLINGSSLFKMLTSSTKILSFKAVRHGNLPFKLYSIIKEMVKNPITNNDQLIEEVKFLKLLFKIRFYGYQNQTSDNFFNSLLTSEDIKATLRFWIFQLYSKINAYAFDQENIYGTVELITEELKKNEDASFKHYQEFLALQDQIESIRSFEERYVVNFGNDIVEILNHRFNREEIMTHLQTIKALTDNSKEFCNGYLAELATMGDRAQEIPPILISTTKTNMHYPTVTVIEPNLHLATKLKAVTKRLNELGNCLTSQINLLTVQLTIEQLLLDDFEQTIFPNKTQGMNLINEILTTKVERYTNDNLMQVTEAYNKLMHYNLSQEDRDRIKQQVVSECNPANFSNEQLLGYIEEIHSRRLSECQDEFKISYDQLLQLTQKHLDSHGQLEKNDSHASQIEIKINWSQQIETRIDSLNIFYHRAERMLQNPQIEFRGYVNSQLKNITLPSAIQSKINQINTTTVLLGEEPFVLSLQHYKECLIDNDSSSVETTLQRFTDNTLAEYNRLLDKIITLATSHTQRAETLKTDYYQAEALLDGLRNQVEGAFLKNNYQEVIEWIHANKNHLDSCLQKEEIDNLIYSLKYYQSPAYLRYSFGLAKSFIWTVLKQEDCLALLDKACENKYYRMQEGIKQAKAATRNVEDVQHSKEALQTLSNQFNGVFQLHINDKHQQLQQQYFVKTFKHLNEFRGFDQETKLTAEEQRALFKEHLEKVKILNEHLSNIDSLENETVTLDYVAYAKRFMDGQIHDPSDLYHQIMYFDRTVEKIRILEQYVNQIRFNLQSPCENDDALIKHYHEEMLTRIHLCHHKLDALLSKLPAKKSELENVFRTNPVIAHSLALMQHYREPRFLDEEFAALSEQEREKLNLINPISVNGLQGVRAARLNLTTVSLCGANLAGAHLQSCLLPGNLSDVNLNDATLENCILQDNRYFNGIKINQNTVLDWKKYGAEMIYANATNIHFSKEYIHSLFSVIGSKNNELITGKLLVNIIMQIGFKVRLAEGKDSLKGYKDHTLFVINTLLPYCKDLTSLLYFAKLIEDQDHNYLRKERGFFRPAYGNTSSWNKLMNVIKEKISALPIDQLDPDNYSRYQTIMQATSTRCYQGLFSHRNRSPFGSKLCVPKSTPSGSTML